MLTFLTKKKLSVKHRHYFQAYHFTACIRITILHNIIDISAAPTEIQYKYCANRYFDVQFLDVKSMS